jgi:sporulation protein YlmC with PRC-barrel domain
MNVHPRIWIALLLACLAVAGLRAAADDPAPSKAPPAKAEPATKAVITPSHKAPATLRMSEILGMTVKNAEGTDLGTVNDVVISTQEDAEQFRRYVILSSGGFLGIGSELIPVPWNSLSLQHDLESNKKYFLLEADKAKLERAPRIAASSWPDFGDPAYTAQVDSYFGITDKPALRSAEKPTREPGSR